MAAELIKQQLVDLINQMTPENFEKGYDPITDLIDNYESRSSDAWFHNIDDEFPGRNSIKEDYEEDYEGGFPDTMSKDNVDYETIFSIHFCGNVFYYSQKHYDDFSIIWDTWDKSPYRGRYNWFYYFLDSYIMDKEYSGHYPWDEGIYSDYLKKIILYQVLMTNQMI